MDPQALPPPETRILVCDPLAPEAFGLLEEEGYRPEDLSHLGQVEIEQQAPGAHAVVVRSRTRVGAAFMDAAGPSLLLIARAGVGVDNVDCAAATARGIQVINAPSGNTTTTAELAIALMCSLARHIPRAALRTREGSWKKSGLSGTELCDKTLGVIGLGRIGSAVAQRGLGLGMKVLGSDPYLAPGRPLPGALTQVELCELDELLERADFVSLHVPLTDSTRHLLSRDRIQRMKRGARLINAARGGLVDEAALLEALEDGRLRGAALDVLEQEPPASDEPLLAREDVIVTPHLGAASDEAQRNVAVETARGVCDFLATGAAVNAVNTPSLSAKMLDALGPHLELVEKLGRFVAQMATPPLEALELSFSGELAELDTRPLAPALVAALLGEVLDAPVNRVNALQVAESRGIAVREAPETERHYLPTLVRVRALGRSGTMDVAGSVFDRTPRLVRFGGVHLDLGMRGPLLVTHHRDRPGVVGLVGTVLGRHDVNIRRIELAPPPDPSQGLATAFLALYDDAPPEAVAEIASLPPIEAAQTLLL